MQFGCKNYRKLYDLKDNFTSPKRFQNNHNIDTKYPGLIQSRFKRIYSGSKAR